MKGTWDSIEQIWSIVEVGEKEEPILGSSVGFTRTIRDFKTVVDGIESEEQALGRAETLAEEFPARFFLVMKSTHVVVSQALPAETSALMSRDELFEEPKKATESPVAQKGPDA